MTEQQGEVEPDAWKFIETIETIDGEEKKSEQATLHHPESDKFQFYLSDIHEVSIEEPLFSGDKIDKQIKEKIKKKVNALQNSPKEHPKAIWALTELGEELGEVFQQQ